MKTSGFSCWPLKSIALAALVALVNCAPPPTLEEVAAETSESISDLLEEAWDTTATATNQSASVDGFVEAQNRQQPPDAGAISRPMMPTRQEDESINRAVNEAREEISRRIFAKENIESSKGDTLTLRIDGDRFCTATDGTPNAQCAEAIDKIELRISVKGDPKKKLTFDLLLGSGRISPLTFTHETGRALQIDFRLTEYKQVLDLLTEVGVALGDDFKRVSRIAGDLRIRLERHARGDFSLSASVTKDVDFELTDGPDRIALQLASTSPTLSMRVNSEAKSHALAAKLGHLVFEVPFGEKSQSGVARRIVRVDFAGADFSASLGLGEGLAQASLIVSSGDSVATYDGAEIVRILEAEPILAILQKDQDDLLQVALNPFRLGVHSNLRQLPDFDASSALAHENFRIALVGPSPTIRTRVLGGGSTAMQLEWGQLTLSAELSGQSLQVEAGQCLTTSSQTSSSSQPLASLHALACE